MRAQRLSVGSEGPCGPRVNLGSHELGDLSKFCWQRLKKGIVDSEANSATTKGGLRVSQVVTWILCSYNINKVKSVTQGTFRKGDHSLECRTGIEDFMEEIWLK